MLKDLIIKNRSYRGYDPSYRVPREDLLDMVDGARLSAASVNRQPIKYVVIDDPEEAMRLLPLTAWGKNLPQLKLPRDGKEPTAWIVICHDKEVDPDFSNYAEDVGIYAQSITLLAAEKDLGCCMIGNFGPEKVKKHLELPDRYDVKLIIAVGKPDETIVLEEIDEGQDTKYYRDENDVHYVPKRKLKDLIIR